MTGADFTPSKRHAVVSLGRHRHCKGKCIAASIRRTYNQEAAVGGVRTAPKQITHTDPRAIACIHTMVPKLQDEQLLS
jgi:hypothetical protein